MREKGDKPKPEPKRAKGGLVKGALAERIRGDPQVQRVRRARAGTILCRLLAQLQAREHDKFAAHLYRSRREYRSACERAGKGGKQIERRIHLDIFRSPRAWASRATFGSGSTCCGSAIESAVR